MKPLLIFFFFAAAFVSRSLADLSDDQLLHIQFDQKINHRVSTNLIFTNELGQPFPLEHYLGRRPVVLMLGYYGCPMLCTMVLNGATENFRNLKESVGQDFEVVFISIDPHETPALAAQKKSAYLRSYHRPGTDGGWHFLVGDTNAIARLADEVGFRYAYDPVSKQFAHPSGLVILTPTGKISRYLLGVTYSASELDTALHQAAADQAGPPSDSLFLLCFHYSPVAGKYGPLILHVVRAAGVAMVFTLGLVIFVHSRGRKPGGTE